MSSIKTLRAEMKSDPVVTKFLRIQDTTRNAVSIPNTQREVSLLHSSRKSRSLTSAKVTPSILQEAILVDLYTRSRLVEIKANVHRSCELITSALKAVKKHVLVSYADTVAEIVSTRGERESVVDRLFSGAVDLREELNSLSLEIDLFVKDIDQSSFALRNTFELLKMVLDRKDSEF